MHTVDRDFLGVASLGGAALFSDPCLVSRERSLADGLPVIRLLRFAVLTYGAAVLVAVLAAVLWTLLFRGAPAERPDRHDRNG